MKSLKIFLDRLIVGLTSTLFVIMVIIIFTQVVARYVFHNSLSWSEELARFIFVWIVFLGSSYVLGHGAHANLDLVLSRLPEKMRLVLEKVNTILLFGFSFIIAKYGYDFIKLGNNQNSSALQIPMNIIYTIIPISGTLLMLYCVFIFFKVDERS